MADGQHIQIDDASRKDLEQFIEAEKGRMKLQESINTFTERCWKQCITSTASKLSSQDEKCLQNCVERFLDANIHIIKTLQSLNMAQKT